MPAKPKTPETPTGPETPILEQFAADLERNQHFRGTDWEIYAQARIFLTSRGKRGHKAAEQLAKAYTEHVTNRKETDQ